MAGIPAWRRRRDPGAVVFCLHDVIGPGESPAGDPALHVPVADFAAYVEWLSSTGPVVSLRELIDRQAQGKSIARLRALTFDDAYEGVFDHALPILRRHGLPATVFVVSDASTGGSPFWWDELGPIPDQQRYRCLQELKGSGTAIHERFAPDRRPLPDTCRAARWNRIAAALDGSVDLGVHTVTHRNLAALDPDDIRTELVDCRAAIIEHTGVHPDLVSYPYGLHSPAVRSAVRDLGFTGAASMRFGLFRPGADRFAIPRVNIPTGLPVRTLDCWSVDLRFRPPS